MPPQTKVMPLGRGCWHASSAIMEGDIWHQDIANTCYPKGSGSVNSVTHVCHVPTLFFLKNILYYWKTEIPLNPPKNNKKKTKDKYEKSCVRKF
jgi:hypothetical protein